MKHRCPVCHKTVNGTNQERADQAKFYPFCSNRCKLIDLGAWLDGRYKVISESQLQREEYRELFDTSFDATSDSH